MAAPPPRPPRRLPALPETRQLYRLLLEEMSALARAAGADLGPGIVETCLGYLDALGAGGYSSLHYDLMHGKRLEIDALQGHAVQIGRASCRERGESRV